MELKRTRVRDPAGGSRTWCHSISLVNIDSNGIQHAPVTYAPIE